jgi:hypothetical protein
VQYAGKIQFETLPFIGMPSPHKERFFSYRDALGVPLSWVVRGSFDILAGGRPVRMHWSASSLLIRQDKFGSFASGGALRTTACRGLLI